MIYLFYFHLYIELCNEKFVIFYQIIFEHKYFLWKKLTPLMSNFETFLKKILCVIILIFLLLQCVE